MNTKVQHSRGFTLVELLVVIAIIGILIGMLMPAVQMVREAARQTSCKNNLKQMGLAILNFEGAKMALPPSRGADRFLTWPVYLMPFMEMQNLSDRLDIRRKYSDQDPIAVQQPVSTMFCPTRSFRSGFLSNRETRGEQIGACGDYAGNAGTSQYFPYDRWAMFEDPVDGIFNSGYADQNPVVGNTLPGGGKGRYRLADVFDGTSTTIFLGEKYVSSYGPQEPQGWGDGSIYHGDEPETFMRIGGYGMGLARNDHLNWTPGEYPIFGSSHYSLVNFTMGDGSVHSLETGISHETLYRLLSREDGLTVEIK